MNNFIIATFATVLIFAFVVGLNILILLYAPVCVQIVFYSACALFSTIGIMLQILSKLDEEQNK